MDNTTPSSPGALETKINVKSWQVMFSLLLAGLAVQAFYDRLNIALTSFDDRAIGIAILTGVDASARSLAYFKMIGLFLLVGILGMVVTALLQDHWVRSSKGLWIKVDQRVLFIMSIMTLCTLLLRILSRQYVYRYAISVMLYLLALNLLMVISQIVYFKMFKRHLHWLESYPIRVLALCFPVVVLFISWVYLKQEFKIVSAHSLAFILLWMGFCVGYAFLVRSRLGKGVETVQLDRALVISGIPFLLIPLSIPLSNELQFALSQISQISPRQLSGLVIAALILLSIVFFFYALRKQHLRLRTSKLIYNIYFPVIIATSTIFLYYHQSLNVGGNETLQTGYYHSVKDLVGFDMFHLGENLIVAQQAFEFGQIPYVDILPTHGLSDVYYQFLYSWINGYRPVEPWLWSWMEALLAFVLIYYLMKAIIDPLSALLITILLPITAVFHNYYTILIVPALTISHIFKKEATFKRYVLLWLICALVFVWRLDYGIAVTAASIFMMAWYGLQRVYIHHAPLLPELKRSVVAFAILAGVSFTLYDLIILVVGGSFRENLAQVIQLIRTLAPVMSSPELSTEFSPLVVFQYVILPGMALVYLGYGLYQVFARQEALSTVQVIMVFLGVVSIFLSIRSVQRHSLVEGYDPYLFGFLLVGMPYYTNKTHKHTSQVIFCAILLGYVMVFPNYDKLFGAGEMFRFHTWTNKEARVEMDGGRYEQLIAFLNARLQDNQTFYDFSNSPMLYVLAHRRLLTYLVPNLLTTSDAVQQAEIRKLKEAYRQDALPYVIFRQGNAWDHVDDVPNEVRSYRIAEFIYAHYLPFAEIDNYMVWARKDLDLGGLYAEYNSKKGYELDPIQAFSQDFGLIKLPYIWGNYDEGKAALQTADLAVLMDQQRRLDAGAPLVLEFDPDLDKTSGNYIHLRIRTDTSARLTLSYGEQEGSRISFDVVPSKRPKDYLVRISSQWAWMSQPINRIALVASGDVEIETIKIKKGD